MPACCPRCFERPASSWITLRGLIEMQKGSQRGTEVWQPHGKEQELVTAVHVRTLGYWLLFPSPNLKGTYWHCGVTKPTGALSLWCCFPGSHPGTYPVSLQPRNPEPPPFLAAGNDGAARGTVAYNKVWLSLVHSVKGKIFLCTLQSFCNPNTTTECPPLKS